MIVTLATLATLAHYLNGMIWIHTYTPSSFLLPLPLTLQAMLKPINSTYALSTVGPARAAAAAAAAACVSGVHAAERLLGHMAIRLLPDMYCVYAQVE